jgi:hypothetical protein
VEPASSVKPGSGCRRRAIARWRIEGWLLESVATAHLIHGYIGAGKTTLARRLELEVHAVRFTPDEWMSRLFGADPAAETFDDKASAILELMEPLWLRCLGLGLDVVLDFGFWRRSQRDHVRQRASEVGAAVMLYALACDEREALRRVAARNAEQDRGLYVAPATFELLKARFEPLGPDEQAVKVPRM